MKTKPLLLLVFSFFLFVSCSQFEAVYKINNLLKNNTKTNIVGDLSQEANSYLISLLGKEISEPKYELFLTSKKTKKKLVISTGSVATKYRTTININYNVYDKVLKCRVYSSEITTSNDFDSRSEGYSFGSDAGEKNSELNNLRGNIDSFLSEMSRYINDLSCIDEG